MSTNQKIFRSRKQTIMTPIPGCPAYGEYKITDVSKPFHGVVNFLDENGRIMALNLPLVSSNGVLSTSFNDKSPFVQPSDITIVYSPNVNNPIKKPFTDNVSFTGGSANYISRNLLKNIVQALPPNTISHLELYWPGSTRAGLPITLGTFDL